MGALGQTMATQDGIPALLAPLTAECSVVEGGSTAAEAARAVGAALSDAMAWRTIRVRPGRGVFEVRTAAGEFVVKAYEAGFMGRMSPLRFCASGREWRAIAAAVNAGIRTAPPVGLLSGRGVNYVITEKLAGVAEFESYLQRERERLLEDTRLARRLVQDFAQFVAGLHKAGLLHHDPHLRNFLLRPPRKGLPAEFFVLDLADESLSPTTPLEGARLKNMAQLSLGFLDAPQSAKRRFLREYRNAVGDAGDEALAARGIAEQAAELMFQRNTMLIAGCGEASSRIARVERGGTLLLIDRAATRADLSQLEAPLARTDPAQWGGLLLGHFETRLGEGHVFKLRGSAGNDAAGRQRALEALWGRLLEMHALGVSVPAPLACVVRGPEILVFGALPGRLESPRQHRDHEALALYEELGHQMLRLHRYGCFVLPMPPEQAAEGLRVAVPPRGGRTLVLAAPDHIFRGAPGPLGPQAVSSLGRMARAVEIGAGERAMKEMLWSYARSLRLDHPDTQALLDEARRTPTGNTLVLTRGIERSRLSSEAAG